MCKIRCEKTFFSRPLEDCGPVIRLQSPGRAWRGDVRARANKAGLAGSAPREKQPCAAGFQGDAAQRDRRAAFNPVFRAPRAPSVLAQRRGWARWRPSPPCPAALSARLHHGKAGAQRPRRGRRPGPPRPQRDSLFPAAHPSQEGQEGCHLKSQRIGRPCCVVPFLIRRLTGQLVVS